jgi:hypothetical protein
MKLAAGTHVLILDSTDDTIEQDRIGMTGIVIKHNANGMTGNTPENPLHVVQFEDGEVHSFWFEELVDLDVTTYYQPALEEDQWGEDLYTFEVYLDKENVEADFPGVEIKEYKGFDIGYPRFVDVEKE